MDKAQSKYRNTAILMNQALLILLEKKDLEFITVKEICEKAGVNRSTFYLHYENISDLFNETVEYLNNDFLSSFPIKNIDNKINTIDANDVVFIRKEFLIPYLEFVKKNKRIMKMIHNKPQIFKNEKVYDKMKKDIFIPTMQKFNVPKEEQHYILEFYTRGVVGIVANWLKFDCTDSIEHVMNIILKCVNFDIK